MAHSSGDRFGPYEIVSPLGAGGMGEVYQARDTRLGRDVALKVLPAAFASDADRLRRFEQEARAAASLSHPNIVAVFDVGTDNETPYVVSELLEGETLRARLQRGALGVGRAVDYAVQVAHGLEAAHEKGIVHRDLKPENVFVTRDERVKILDFGLAKLREDVAPSAGPATIATTTPDTVPGAMLGTLVYMSPEQLRSQPVDDRTDLFALGAILYELLSGRRPFQGSTIPDTIGAILMKDPPDLTLTNHEVPVGLNMIVRRALEKAPEQRFQSARDLAFALEALRTARVETSSLFVGPSGAGRVSRRRLLAWAVLASAAALALLSAILRERERPAPAVVRLTVTLPDALVSPHGLATQLAVSPDGKYVAFTAQAGVVGPRLWLRSFDSLGIVGEPGNLVMMGLSPDGLRQAYGRRDLSTGAQNLWVADLTRNIATRLTFEPGVDADAVWSPDGRQIAFASSRGGRKSLFVIPASGGPERVLLASTGPLSMDAWSPDGRFILYHTSPTREMLASPLAGDGKPFVVVKPRVGIVDEPAFSPDGRWVAYNADESGRYEIYVTRFPAIDVTRQISTAGGVQPRWRDDGRELFFLALDGTMMSVDVRGSDTIEPGQPRALFQTHVVASGGVDQYAATPGGQRFLVMQPFGENRMMPLAAVLNWPSLTAR